MNNNNDIALYVHWPWCKSKCPYCDFNSHAANQIPEEDYVKALIQDLNNQSQTAKKKNLISIYFGGGTPSLMKPKSIEKIINEAAKLFTFSNNIEISMEANPTSSTNELFKTTTKTGINRFSIGVQSLTKEDLKFLGREHSAEEAIQTIENALNHCSNVNLDLIYGLPNQKLTTWEQSLKTAIKLGTPHISAYQLTIEANTVFYAEVNKGKWKPLNDDKQIHFIEKTEEILGNSDFNNYEISNFAKQNHKCIHNNHIWEYGDFIGIGAGAHGRVTNINSNHTLTQNYKMPLKYIEEVQKNGIALVKSEKTSTEQQAIESLIMGLRLQKGFALKPNFLQFYDIKQVDFLVKNNILDTKNDVFKLTSGGWHLLDEVLTRIIP